MEIEYLKCLKTVISTTWTIAKDFFLLAIFWTCSNIYIHKGGEFFMKRAMILNVEWSDLKTPSIWKLKRLKEHNKIRSAREARSPCWFEIELFYWTLRTHSNIIFNPFAYMIWFNTNIKIVFHARKSYSFFFASSIWCCVFFSNRAKKFGDQLKCKNIDGKLSLSIQ